ncbi:MAG: GNAT family N-acetyltransferase [Lawsonibacter sp.]
MKFERITSPDHPAFAQAFALYEISFPIHERRFREKQENVLAHPEYHCEVILEAGKFIGILLYWEYEGGFYVEHFAVDPALRGQSYGSRALRALGKQGKPVVLEIDPPVDEISVRRKHFYQKIGFQENTFPHVHPPYRPGFKGHDLVIMSFPGPLNKQEYETFASYLANTVMADCQDVNLEKKR